MARKETADATPSGARLIEYDVLPSTSAEAAKRVARGERGPLWVLAERQTDGYGRRGRGWSQSPGDFAGTYLAPSPLPPERIGELSFIGSLAVYEALERECGAARLSLKWPNDIMLDGAKTGGILLELHASEPTPVVAVGIGLNIVNRPPDGVAPYPTARLADAVDKQRGLPEPYDLACAIDGHFLSLVSLWKRSGFAPIREAWLARAHGVGTELTVTTPTESYSGRFEGVDAHGRLILNPGTPGLERVRIDAGDVFFSRGNISRDQA